MRLAALLILLIVVLASVPAQAQSPALTFDYTSSTYTASPFNLVSILGGSDALGAFTYDSGAGYRVTAQYSQASNGIWGNRSCLTHYFGGTFTSLTRFGIGYTAISNRLFAQFYDTNATLVYSGFWDTNPSGAYAYRDVTVSETNVRYVILCLYGGSNVNNNALWLNALDLYGTFVPDGVDFEADPVDGEVPLEVTFTNTSNCPDASPNWQWDFDGDEVTDSTDEDPDPYTYTEPGTYIATLSATCNGALDTASQTITVNSGITRPLADYDQLYLWDDVALVSDPDNPLTDILARDPYSVAAISTEPGDYVYAIQAGTVTGIEKLEPGDCFGLYETAYQQCLLRRDPSAFGETIGITDELYFVDTSPLYRVVVTYDETYSLEYIVADPFVYPGMVLQENCIIGITAELQQLDSGQMTYYTAMARFADLTWSPVINSIAGTGVAFVSLFDHNTFIRASLYPSMTETVIPGAACNANGGACINDSTFSDPGQWATTGDVVFEPLAGVTLQPGASISQAFPFQDGITYSLTASIYRPLNSGTAYIWFSEEIATFSLAFGTQDYNLSHEFADGDDLFVQVVNMGAEPFTVERFCITDGSAGETIPQCYFQNPSFDLGLDGWDTTGDVFAGEVGGSVMAYDNGTIYQNVHLYPDGGTAHTYKIYIKAFVPTGFLGDSGTYIQFDYTFGTYSGTFTAYGDSSPAAVAFTTFASYPGYTRTFELDLSVNTDTDQNFYIVSNLTGTTSGKFVQIAEVCIDDAFDTRPPGDPPLSPVCTRIETPAGDANVGAWTVYLWGNLNNFFQCDLMVLLNSMYKVAQQGLSYIRWTGTYTQYVLTRYNTYLWDVFGWLGGHFANMAGGRTTIIQSSGTGQCSDLFCIIGILFDGIADFIGGLDELGTAIVDGLAGSFEAVVNVISQLLDIIRLVLDFLIGIIEQVIGLLIDLISALFSFLFNILNTALIAVQRALGLFTTMGGLWNEMNASISMGGGDSPETLDASSSVYEIDPGIGEGASGEDEALSGLEAFIASLQCTTEPRTKAICITIWLFDNTVMYSFGEWLFWSIVLVSSPSAILWAIARFRKAVSSLKGT